MVYFNTKYLKYTGRENYITIYETAKIHIYKIYSDSYIPFKVNDSAVHLVGITHIVADADMVRGRLRDAML